MYKSLGPILLTAAAVFFHPFARQQATATLVAAEKPQKMLAASPHARVCM